MAALVTRLQLQHQPSILRRWPSPSPRPWPSLRERRRPTSGRRNQPGRLSGPQPWPPPRRGRYRCCNRQSPAAAGCGRRPAVWLPPRIVSGVGNCARPPSRAHPTVATSSPLSPNRQSLPLLLPGSTIRLRLIPLPFPRATPRLPKNRVAKGRRGRHPSTPGPVTKFLGPCNRRDGDRRSAAAPAAGEKFPRRHAPCL